LSRSKGKITVKLTKNPNIELRRFDWLIDFGDNGYVARYRFEGEGGIKWKQSTLRRNPCPSFA
jgi:hypothetical protein